MILQITTVYKCDVLIRKRSLRQNAVTNT